MFAHQGEEEDWGEVWWKLDEAAGGQPAVKPAAEPVVSEKKKKRWRKDRKRRRTWHYHPYLL